VTFTLPALVEAQEVALLGDFNEWSSEANPLERTESGDWQTVVNLEAGRSYRFRYLLDGERWENAWSADDYLPNPHGTDDSLVVV
jgi:1,4-alpha-glucan branching enzyme